MSDEIPAVVRMPETVVDADLTRRNGGQEQVRRTLEQRANGQSQGATILYIDLGEERLMRVLSDMVASRIPGTMPLGWAT